MTLLGCAYYGVDAVVAWLREVVGIVEYECRLDPFGSWDRGALIGDLLDLIDYASALVAHNKLDPAVAISVSEGEWAASLVGDSGCDVDRFVAEVLLVVRFKPNADLSKEWLANK